MVEYTNQTEDAGLIALPIEVEGRENIIDFAIKNFPIEVCNTLIEKLNTIKFIYKPLLIISEEEIDGCVKYHLDLTYVSPPKPSQTTT